MYYGIYFLITFHTKRHVSMFRITPYLKLSYNLLPLFRFNQHNAYSDRPAAAQSMCRLNRNGGSTLLAI
jgi:hypothetical protein